MLIAFPQNYHTKAALVILHSRVELPPSFSKGSSTARVNRWVSFLPQPLVLVYFMNFLTDVNETVQFNVELEDTDVLKDQLRTWRACDATENRPPPLIIETYLDTKDLTNNQSLVILDENGKRWDVVESLAISRQTHPSKVPQSGSDDITLERWKIELGDTSSKLPADLGSILPTVYKKSIVLFRSLYSVSKMLPAWRFAKRNRKLRANPALRIKYRIVSGRGASQTSGLDHLTVPLYETDGKVVDTYRFGTTESPAGPFSVEVTHRNNCDFRVDDSEALLSSRFMGADDEIFRPSIPSGDMERAEVGSVPVQRQPVGDPDPSRAYGSLSTFHHVGPTSGTSPISALRIARDTGTLSPSPGGSPSQKPLSAAKIGSAGRASALANEGSHARRSSISFQPFKAPPVSASPSLVDPPLGASPRSGASRTVSSEPKNVPPTSAPAAARKPMPTAPENAIASSNSASPRPAPISRYSSAFSHRRARPSFGGSNKAEDDTSSGKASAASSSAQPGSGLLAEPTGTSADSIHADDENISEFLKMLDLRKDLMNPASSSNVDAPNRRTTATTAALSRFQRMRDSNAALSDSMSSSLHLHRSSNSSSKQLSGVPPMVAGTSISAASSPGKPVSPHTPHTPAIPSRLSSNSIVAYNEPESDPHRFPSDGHGSPYDDSNPSGETQSTAIDIPRSPFLPATYAGTGTRDTGSGPADRTSAPDEDDDFPFPMRSVSAGDRHTHSLSAMQQDRRFENVGTADDQRRRATHPSSLNEDAPLHSGPTTGAYRDVGSLRNASTSSPSNNHMYMPRFTHSRGRGSSGGGGRSLSSGSGSVARGGIPHSFPEREHDREGNGSGSNSGGSTTEARRGSGQRPGSSRAHTQQTPVEEEEPLLFAMSDFGTSRRSLEEGRHGNHGVDSSGNTGSRRGSGRRGMGPPGFHVWS